MTQTITVAGTLTDSAGNKGGFSSAVAVAPPVPVWPDATTTGYGSTSLTAASSYTISSPGTYSGLHFTTGTVTIAASNVTLINSLVTMNPGDQWGLGVNGGLTGVVIQNVEIAGPGTSSTLPAANYGIYLTGNSAVQVLACNVHGVVQGIVLNDGQVLVKDCYSHDLNGKPGGNNHYENLGYFGAGTSTFSLDVEHNNFNNQNNQTAAVFLQSYFGKMQNITVNNNLLIGGDFTVYVDANPSGGDDTDPVTNVSVTNNALGAGIFGYFDFIHGSGTYGVVHTGNYDYITNAAVP